MMKILLQQKPRRAFPVHVSTIHKPTIRGRLGRTYSCQIPAHTVIGIDQHEMGWSVCTRRGQTDSNLHPFVFFPFQMNIRRRRQVALDHIELRETRQSNRPLVTNQEDLKPRVRLIRERCNGSIGKLANTIPGFGHLWALERDDEN